MINRFLKLLRWLFFILYSVICYIFLIKIVQPELHFHLQQPPFLFDKFFFFPYLTYPGGISEYIATFLMQLFFYKGIGAIVILLTGWLISFLSLKIFRIFNQKEYVILLIFIPFIAYLSLFNNYYFPFSVSIKILIALTATWISINFVKDFFKSFVSFLILSLIVYYLAGSGAFIIFSSTSLILNLYLQKLRSALTYLISATLFIVAMPYFAYKFIFCISPSHIYFSFLPDLVNFMSYRPTIFYYIFCFCLPVIVLFLFIFSIIHIQLPVNKTIKIDKKSFTIFKSIIFNRWVNIGAGLLIIVFSSYFVLVKTRNVHKKNIVACDYYCYTEKWDDVIKLALSDSNYDYYINLNFNRSIDHTGHFTDLFFYYPQLVGEVSLYPDYLYAGEALFSASDFYYDLGYISESRHWAYEALVYFPYSQRAMKSLVLSHLILGEYEGARKYLNILKTDMVSSDFVKRYEPLIDDTTLIFKNHDLMQKRRLLPRENELSNLLSQRFDDLLDANPQNKRAYEHLQIDYMLNHQLNSFMKNLVLAKQYYRTLPEIFEQAILVNCLVTKSAIPEYLNFNPSTIDRFNEFSRILIQNKENINLAKSELFEKFGNTYMYYLNFNSPKVTKAVIRKREESDPLY
jgi:hypothetical protein